MGFMNSMKSTLNEDFNESYTENGALGYRTTGRHLLDLNFKVASLRKADAETIISGFDKAFSEDHIHALKTFSLSMVFIQYQLLRLVTM